MYISVDVCQTKEDLMTLIRDEDTQHSETYVCKNKHDIVEAVADFINNHTTI
jgi:hypothetical protein